MTGNPDKIPGAALDWYCRPTWRQSAKNTWWCLVGCASGDFATHEMGSSGMALYFACRAFAFLWTTIEAFLYHAQLRRRLSLGLADPLVAGQILLWGISGASAVGLTAVISISIFALRSHPFEIPGVMALVTVFALTTGASMYGAFFPPAFMRRRMASGATTPGS